MKKIPTTLAERLAWGAEVKAWRKRKGIGLRWAAGEFGLGENAQNKLRLMEKGWEAKASEYVKVWERMREEER